MKQIIINETANCPENENEKEKSWSLKKGNGLEYAKRKLMDMVKNQF